MQFPGYFLLPLVIGIPAVAATLKVCTAAGAAAYEYSQHNSHAPESANNLCLHPLIYYCY